VNSLEIRLLSDGDIEPLAGAFAAAGSSKTASLFERYVAEQCHGERVVLVAVRDASICGYVTIVWESDYPPFNEAGIPEINDFNVLPQFRQRGIGTSLLDEAERRISVRSPLAGIGVGLYTSYGPAQRLYIKRGYIPDGNGVSSSGRVVGKGELVAVDDDLALYFTKNLSSDVITAHPNGD
jgi:ribosomal protein S18 acetylase RimI-like enzyme